MMVGIDPKVDYAFKKIFGREDEQLALRDLLQAVLEPDVGAEIRELDILNPFSSKDALDDKLSILDLRARDQSNREFLIEMQMRAPWFYPNRILYYWANFHQSQSKEGDFYQTLRPTILICFVNEVLFDNVDNHHLVFTLRDETHKVTLTDNLRIHVIQLPLFRKGVTELKTALDRWCWFLRHGAELDPANLPATLETPAIRRAVENLTMISLDRQERERYESRRKAERDRASEIRDAEERGLDRGDWIGQIRAYERVLNLPVSSRERFDNVPLVDLIARANRLAEQVQAGGSS